MHRQNNGTARDVEAIGNWRGSRESTADRRHRHRSVSSDFQTVENFGQVTLDGVTSCVERNSSDKIFSVRDVCSDRREILVAVHAGQRPITR